jgi:hypothetical protein
MSHIAIGDDPASVPHDHPLDSARSRGVEPATRCHGKRTRRNEIAPVRPAETAPASAFFQLGFDPLHAERGPDADSFNIVSLRTAIVADFVRRRTRGGETEVLGGDPAFAERGGRGSSFTIMSFSRDSSPSRCGERARAIRRGPRRPPRPPRSPTDRESPAPYRTSHTGWLKGARPMPRRNVVESAIWMGAAVEGWGARAATGASRPRVASADASVTARQPGSRPPRPRGGAERGNRRGGEGCGPPIHARLHRDGP